MTFTPYPSYADSGIEWLGKLPDHWAVRRLKTSAKYRVSNVDKLSSEDEISVRLCNYVDVYYNDHICMQVNFMEATATHEEIDRFRLNVNDVVITKDSEDWRDIAVPALVVEAAPDLICGYHLAIVRPEKTKLAGPFLLRAFQACAINQQFQIAATGVTRYGLPKSSIGNAWIPLPPFSEQQSIAEFLDAETAKLDALVVKKRRLIERLTEKRSALISRTVTRGLPPNAAAEYGLDPNPPLTPSGIDWLGEIPNTWGLVPLGYLVLFRGGATPDKSCAEYWDGEIPWISPKDMKTSVITDAIDRISQDALANTSLTLIPNEAVIIVVRGMILAHSFPVALVGTPVTINQDMKAMIPLGRMLPHYLFHALVGFARVFVSLAGESAHGTRKLETTDIVRFPFPVPPQSDQHAIINFLDRETAKIDQLVDKVEDAITRLQEYRSAIITAAVTGKIDVRGVAA